MDATKLFTVTPMSQRFELEPGQTYEGKVTVINPNDAKEDFNYKVYVAPYGVTGEENGADLLTETPYTKIKDWITIEEPTGTLKPNQANEIHYTIQVPENVPAGGQYAAIVISQDDQAEAGGNGMAVKDIFELASLIYGTVNGETIHKGEILENNIPGFVTEGPITMGVKVKNEGNIHENADIIIKATDMFTGRVIVGNEEVDGRYSEIVMPETTRYIERNISENLPALGIVHVEQTVMYDGQTLEAVRDVIICPAWFIILVGVVIGVIIGMIIRIVYKHKKKKRQAEGLM